MNHVSAGIALCHLWLAVAHSGRTPKIVIEESEKASSPKGYSYVASMIIG